MMAVDLHNTDQSLLSSSDNCFSMNKLIWPKNNTVTTTTITTTTTTTTTTTWPCFGSSDSGSVLSSPGESELGSTETEEESDPEEDYCAELSRQMAHYMLQDDDKHDESWGSTSSPQSTLWPPFGSNHESPKGPSREPSPPLSTMIEELEKVKINNYFNNYSEIPSSISNQTADFHSKQALIDDQIRAIQFHRLKQEQTMKQHDNIKQLKQYQNKTRAFGGFNNGQKTNRPPSSTTSSSSSWSNVHQAQTQTTYQQQPGSGMRAVFLGGSTGSRASSCGTGVFLPRGVGYSPDQSRKKSGCATVLIPARVAQALKQHFDKMGGGGLPSGFNATNFPQLDVLGGKNSVYSQLQQQQQQHQQQNQSMNKQEIGLPQEWTY